MIKVLGAGVLAFAVSTGIGKWLVPWLKKHGFIQPVKKEVETAVYSDRNGSKTEVDP